jgi:hypothetical protein
MALALFLLIGYLMSTAYLVGWLFNQAWMLYRKGSEGRFQRQMAGKVLSLKPQSQKSVLAVSGECDWSVLRDCFCLVGGPVVLSGMAFANIGRYAVW